LIIEENLKSNSMETAVEWLVRKLEAEPFIGIPSQLVRQAKEMEKEQIVNAFEIGYDNGACVQEGSAIYHGSNYYNETFKSE
jgi:hypothetical protein